MKAKVNDVDMIQDRSLGAIIVRRLQTSIVDGEYARGEHLLETELAEMFGVSRGPVRDALRTLRAEGWVEIRPRVGAFVCNPTPREVDEFFHVKGILEAEAARLAANAATEEGIQSLRDILALGMEAVENAHAHALVELSTEFHLRLAEQSGNSMLSDLLRPVQKRLPFFFAFSAGAGSVNVEAWVEHGEIIEALETRDGERAARIMIDHSDTAKAGYQHRLAPVSQ